MTVSLWYAECGRTDAKVKWGNSTETEQNLAEKDDACRVYEGWLILELLARLNLVDNDVILVKGMGKRSLFEDIYKNQIR